MDNPSLKLSLYLCAMLVCNLFLTAYLQEPLFLIAEQHSLSYLPSLTGVETMPYYLFIQCLALSCSESQGQVQQFKY